MSGLVMGLALRVSQAEGYDRLVLVAIGDCCEDDGTGAWPSIPTLAKRARISERTVQRSIQELQALDELDVEKGAGPKGTNLYSINVGLLLDRLQAERRGDSVVTGATASPPSTATPGGDTAMAPDPSTDPSIEKEHHRSRFPSSPKRQKKVTNPLDPGTDTFEFLFWPIYPRPEKKQTALHEWALMTDDERQLAIDDVPQRIAKNWHGTETGMIPHPSSYLHQKRWTEPLLDLKGNGHHQRENASTRFKQWVDKERANGSQPSLSINGNVDSSLSLMGKR